jgi:hypothetical protein
MCRSRVCLPGCHGPKVVARALGSRPWLSHHTEPTSAARGNIGSSNLIRRSDCPLGCPGAQHPPDCVSRVFFCRRSLVGALDGDGSPPARVVGDGSRRLGRRLEMGTAGKSSDSRGVPLAGDRESVGRNHVDDVDHADDGRAILHLLASKEVAPSPRVQFSDPMCQ